MRIKDPEFSSVAQPVSMPLTEETILIMQSYKVELIEFMLLLKPTKWGEFNKTQSDILIMEIKRVESWLQKHWIKVAEAHKLKLTA